MTGAIGSFCGSRGIIPGTDKELNAGKDRRPRGRERESNGSVLQEGRGLRLQVPKQTLARYLIDPLCALSPSPIGALYTPDLCLPAIFPPCVCPEQEATILEKLLPFSKFTYAL